jgi:hypothetical protein
MAFDAGDPLLIYQTDNQPGFYYNKGTPLLPEWISLSTLSRSCHTGRQDSY